MQKRLTISMPMQVACVSAR